VIFSIILLPCSTIRCLIPFFAIGSAALSIGRSLSRETRGIALLPCQALPRKAIFCAYLLGQITPCKYAYKLAAICKECCTGSFSNILFAISKAVVLVPIYSVQKIQSADLCSLCSCR
jgi:hypothetical protein